MEKIPTALVRDPNNRSKVLPEITPGCEWVFAGEGVPTRKWDGTCVMLDESGKWWARREVKVGQNIPPNFMAVTEQDQVTGKIQGWIPMDQSPFAKYHAEALTDKEHWTQRGTYELVGPKINGNPDNMVSHTLIRHEEAQVLYYMHEPLSPELIMLQISELGKYPGWEGVVWHHPDGRMAKLKAKDL